MRSDEQHPDLLHQFLETQARIRPDALALICHEVRLTYADLINDAIRRWPYLLVVDRLYAENAMAILDAAQADVRVLVLLDTVFRGTDVARQLLDWGVPPERLAAGDRGFLALPRLLR